MIHKIIRSSALAFIAVALTCTASAQVAPIEGIGRPLCRNLQPVDFQTDASVGQWLLGYYSGALAMNMSASMAHGQQISIPDRARDWDDEKLLESARAFCANHPDQPLYKVANMIVTMVVGE